MTNIVYRGSCEGLQEQTFLNHVSKLINNDPRCKNKVYFDLINHIFVHFSPIKIVILLYDFLTKLSN